MDFVFLGSPYNYDFFVAHLDKNGENSKVIESALSNMVNGYIFINVFSHSQE